MRQIADNSWFHPAIVYFMAPFVAVLPLSEAVIRFPSVVVGIVNVCLLFLIARRIFGSDRYAFLAAGLLALTPTHILHSRMAMDYLYPVPFVMGWLMCLLIYLERRRLKWLFIAGLLLGFGFYSYIASVVMMPLYLLLTVVVLFRSVTRPFKECLVAGAGFAAPLTIVVLWLAANPAVIEETLSRYAVSSDSVTGMAFSDLTRRLSIYWSFFDPGFLFVSGGYTHMMNSTRRVGVFLLPLLVFLPVGFVRLAAAPRQPIDPLLLLGFGLAPARGVPASGAVRHRSGAGRAAVRGAAGHGRCAHHDDRDTAALAPRGRGTPRAAFPFTSRSSASTIGATTRRGRHIASRAIAAARWNR